MTAIISYLVFTFLYVNLKYIRTNTDKVLVYKLFFFWMEGVFIIQGLYNIGIMLYATYHLNRVLAKLNQSKVKINFLEEVRENLWDVNDLKD